jgi:predicted TIM-barrel fold metal-dependent hydrolase
MIVDVNLNLSRWPFRRLPCDEMDKLIARLKKWDVAQAWAGSFDGVFHRDVGGVNRRLADDCRERGQGMLLPFGTVNPMLPDWAEDVRRCDEDHQMPGIRLHPNYHGYSLDNPVFAELLKMAADRGMIVQLAVRMDDIRVQHRLMQVADVDVAPLADVVAACPNLRLVLVNALGIVRGDRAKRLIAAGDVSFEISMLEGVGGVVKRLDTIPLDRLLFGSHLPLFNLESAVLKLQESELSDKQLNAISSENAKRLLSKK